MPLWNTDGVADSVVWERTESGNAPQAGQARMVSSRPEQSSERADERSSGTQEEEVAGPGRRLEEESSISVESRCEPTYLEKASENSYA